jgi:hypothetical protein
MFVLVNIAGVKFMVYIYALHRAQHARRKRRTLKKYLGGEEHNLAIAKKYKPHNFNSSAIKRNYRRCKRSTLRNLIMFRYPCPYELFGGSTGVPLKRFFLYSFLNLPFADSQRNI